MRTCKRQEISMGHVSRKYRKTGSSKQFAGIIAGEVVQSGKSDWWQWSLEELSQAEKILSVKRSSAISEERKNLRLKVFVQTIQPFSWVVEYDLNTIKMFRVELSSCPLKH